jgi:hypothetical protein
MHFSKTYSQLLLTLPPDLRDNAIQYRQLKKLINQVVLELTSLGLDPDVLSALLTSARSDKDELEGSSSSGSASGIVKVEEIKASEPGNGELESTEATEGSTSSSRSYSKIVYELHGESDRIQPRLRLWQSTSASEGSQESAPVFTSVSGPAAQSVESVESGLDDEDDATAAPQASGSGSKLLYRLQSGNMNEESGEGERVLEVVESGDAENTLHPALFQQVETSSQGQEVIIPLLSDTAFYQLLYDAIQSLTNHMESIRANFDESLRQLSKDIVRAARPTSSEHSAGVISHFTQHKSDLESWRSIFGLYIDSQVFESVSEQSRGERSIEDCEKRLELFAKQVTKMGHDRLHLKRSRMALDGFLKANLTILYVKKFQYANAEATRKILKKHAKRTALPLPLAAPSSPDLSVATIPKPSTSLARLLVQALGETLLPVVPHIDDYSCLICMNLAFKPIRLNCKHLFCVRCLVKMQKRGQDHCPMCRAPTVGTADRCTHLLLPCSTLRLFSFV